MCVKHSGRFLDSDCVKCVESTVGGLGKMMRCLKVGHPAKKPLHADLVYTQPGPWWGSRRRDVDQVTSSGTCVPCDPPL